jgi:hypothetical protein
MTAPLPTLRRARQERLDLGTPVTLLIAGLAVELVALIAFRAVPILARIRSKIPL